MYTQLLQLSTRTLKEYSEEYQKFYATDIAYNSYPRILCESKANYHEVRVFLTMLARITDDVATKLIIKNLLKSVTKLEILKVPIPVIPKITMSGKPKSIPGPTSITKRKS